MSSKKLFVSAVFVAGALVTGMAQARSDVQWSLSIGIPVGVPIYSQPYPVYTPAYPVHTRPAPVYPQRQFRQPTRWDVDGDGVPNRYDRVHNPRWDRDGDGVPNRYDRHDQARNDRDHDGIPNWQDRNDGRRGR